MGKIRILLVMILLAFANVVFSQDGKVLNVPLVKQGDRDLCWAAVGVEIAQYYNQSENCIIDNKNEPITLCNFVAKARPNTCKDCCKKGLPVKKDDENNPCIQTGSITGETMPTMKKFGVPCKYLGSALSFDECISQIVNGMPFIVHWFYHKTKDNIDGAHVVVGRGYEKPTKKVYYVDSSGDFNIVSYDWLKKHSSEGTNGYSWEKTIVMENSPRCENSNLIYRQTIASNSQIKSTNDIEVSSVISAKSVTFEFGNEFTANPGFEVKLGSTVEIKPNTTLKCK